MTGGTPRIGRDRHDEEQTNRVTAAERRSGAPDARNVAQSVGRRSLSSLVVGVAGLVASSATARAHEVGHVVLDHGDGAASFIAVLGLPALAGLVGGAAAVRYCGRKTSAPTDRLSSGAVGVLVVGLGIASLFSAMVGHRWLSVAGVIVGVAIALQFQGGETAPEAGRGTHAELALGAISTHRLLEGVLVGTLYAAGAAVGLVGAIALAGHAALETATVGGLYVTTRRRIRVAGVIVFVQVGYVVGAVAGLGVAGAVPVSARTFVLAAVGGLLLVVGVNETERSITAGRSARSER